jgi:hypothetical protein
MREAYACSLKKFLLVRIQQEAVSSTIREAINEKESSTSNDFLYY